MLIAIMGDTFANNIQEQDINSCTEQIRIMDEAAPLIEGFDLVQNKDDQHEGEHSDEDEVLSDDEEEDGDTNAEAFVGQSEKEQEGRKSNLLYVVITDEENTADT